MAKVGKFLKKYYKDKIIEIYSGIDREWINYSDSSVINGTVIRGIFSDYDEDCGVITLKAVKDHRQFFIAEDSVELFWEPGFKVLENFATILNTGNKLFNQKNRDIM